MPGSSEAIGTGERSASIEPLIFFSHVRWSRRDDSDLVLVGERDSAGRELEPRCCLPTLAGDGVGTEQADLLDEVDATDLLQRGVRLPGLDRAAPRPAAAIGPTDQRVEVAMKDGRRLLAHAHDAELRL